MNEGDGHHDIEAGGGSSTSAPTPATTSPPTPKGRRLASLDVFRGITVLVSKRYQLAS
jgi:hypothetical protein